MINIKYCEDCGQAYDYHECPFCKEERRKIMEEDIENGEQKTLE